MSRPIIGLAGLMGAGKSAAAAYLEEHHGFRRIRIAGAIKDMARAFGLTEREIEGDLKEVGCDMLGGRTPRYFMQKLGTEFGRDMITHDLWVRAWRRSVDAAPDGVGVVVEDVRYGNECEAIRAASPFSLIVRIQRSDASAGAAEHVSELQSFPHDVLIRNDADIQSLHEKVNALLLCERLKAAP